MLENLEHCTRKRTMVTDREDFAESAIVLWRTEEVDK
jgi:hypothetical protein